MGILPGARRRPGASPMLQARSTRWSWKSPPRPLERRAIASARVISALAHLPHLQEIMKKAEIAIAQNIAKMRSPELARAITAMLAVRTRCLCRR
jgi:hypothetical protein